MYGEVRIVESWLMVDRVEDWSRVRSPSRARRRMKRGFRQNVSIIETPKKSAISMDGGRTLYIHPVTARVLRQEIDRANRAALLPHDGKVE
jgi:hypothetical protein